MKDDDIRNALDRLGKGAGPDPDMTDQVMGRVRFLAQAVPQTPLRTEGGGGASSADASRRRRSVPRWLNMLVPSVAALLIVAFGAVWVFWSGSGTVAWAQVVEKFSSVRSFAATVYMRKDALSEPEQFEVWMGGAGRMRIKAGSQVIFGSRAEGTRAFDVSERKEVTAKPRTRGLIRMLGDKDRFSLEVVVDTFSGGQLKDVTPQVNKEEAVARDLVIYDIQSPRSPEWGRIWALRESKLPVRIQVWDPRDGGCVEAVFTYGSEPGESFFDPDTFASRMKDQAVSNESLPYMGLQDAGGRTFAPAPMPRFSKALTAVTRTLEGEPWSLKDQLGRVTVIHVWDTAPTHEGRMPKQWELMRLYEKYGHRDDFQIVTLAYTDTPPYQRGADRARKMKADQQIPWLFLYEEKGWQGGELVRALRLGGHTTLYLVDRRGQITGLYDVLQPEFALVGPTYENAGGVPLYCRAAVRAGELTTETVRRIFGEPDEVGDSPVGPGRGQWCYVYRDERREHERRIAVDFDRETGIIIDLGCQFLTPESARLSLTITPEYWRDQVLPQIDAAYRPENDTQDRYQIKVGLARREGRIVYSFHGTSRTFGRDYEPGPPAERFPLHGTYRILVTVVDHASQEDLQEIVLRNNLVLEKNSKTEIVLE